eukprot:Gb_19158 [translate_table: standard]
MTEIRFTLRERKKTKEKDEHLQVRKEAPGNGATQPSTVFEEDDEKQRPRLPRSVWSHRKKDRASGEPLKEPKIPQNGAHLRKIGANFRLQTGNFWEISWDAMNLGYSVLDAWDSEDSESHARRNKNDDWKLVRENTFFAGVSERLIAMPRGSRHKSHRQHHKQSVKDLADSDEGENTRYGPELLPEPKTEGKRLREEGKLEISKEKHEIQKKKSQPQSRELGPGNSSATYFPAKKKKGEALEAVETEASVVSPPPLSVDRWNGGEAQGDALSLLAYLHCNKDKDSKTDSESSDRNVGFVEDKEDGRIEEKSHKLAKGKAPDVGSGSSRPLAIDTPDAFQPNANAKASRNKGSRRREAQEATISQGSSLKFAEETPLVAKVDPDTLNSGKSTLAKSATTKSGTKGRWDKGVARKELKEVDEGTTSRDAQRSSERDKKLRNTKPEKVLGVVAGTVRNLEGNSKQGFSNEGFQEEASDKQEQKNTGTLPTDYHLKWEPQ